MKLETMELETLWTMELLAMSLKCDMDLKHGVLELEAIDTQDLEP